MAGGSGQFGCAATGVADKGTRNSADIRQRKSRRLALDRETGDVSSNPPVLQSVDKPCYKPWPRSQHQKSGRWKVPQRLGAGNSYASLHERAGSPFLRSRRTGILWFSVL